MSHKRKMLIVIALLVMPLSCEAFSPTVRVTTSLPRESRTKIDSLLASSVSDFPLPLSSSSVELSAATLDPTTLLSDILGAVIGTPIILAVPILLALGVAGILVFALVSYANPEVEDDEI
eukprot:CAMPEP_0170808226 /NCGR_PEP_ID=MMETSP0733-20121128/33269_1 /TAXON_ID=186038 /ORGANISM="Fragilariopsis kerguelensis, Strain L26-C5" /LENGTH=119 /DNA_ID=CAMNT_0011163617 /DNA_START=98 /DNA_END=457 /DNA_ORIENTATION=+